MTVLESPRNRPQPSTTPHESISGTKKYPIVGVVTPVRNRKDLSVAFVHMFCAQEYPLFRLYIVDSDSTDGTPDAIRALGRASVVVIDAPSSAYWTAATNAGVKRALSDNCEYILTINDNAVIPCDFLSRLVDTAIGGDALIVGSVISYVEEPGRLWGVGAYNDWKSGAFVQTDMANIWDDALDDDMAARSRLLPVDYLCGNGTLVHRSVFDEIGLYNEKFTPHYHADTELTMRAKRAGIERYVAREARLYNRFLESKDGAFATKNLRLFSLRSANYLRALLFILDEYCPSQFRVSALVRYLGRYLPAMDSRTRSKILRAILLLSGVPRAGGRCAKALFPPLDPDLGFAEDLEILCTLPAYEFVAASYAYLLHRPCSDAELNNYAIAVSQGKPYEEVLAEIIGSVEHKQIAGTRFPFESHLIALFTKGAVPLAFDAASLTPCQDAIIEIWRDRGKIPTLGESRARVAALRFSGKNNKNVATAQSGTDPNDDVPLHCEDDASGELPDLARVTVYFNIDVLCMAVADPRAATGVHRYVSSLLRELLTDRRVDVRIFFSTELREYFDKLIRQHPGWQSKLFGDTERIKENGLVFYPYFPFGEKDRRFVKLAQVMTICDLFPLTNPEWFSTAASDTFRRQLRGLLDVNHVFCISHATKNQLQASFPTLAATSSVAHLAANKETFRSVQFLDKIKRRVSGKRYFVCVGTIEPRKNLRNVIAALSFLRPAEIGDLEMLVIGQEGWSITAGELQVMAGSMSKRIRFLGRVSDKDLRRLYEGAVCTVFCSLAEGFGLPIVESFACGTPVITSNTSSMKELAKVGAILVDPLNPREIARAIGLLTTDKKLRARLATAARAQSTEFSWTKCADDHVREFLRLKEHTARSNR